MSTVKSLHIPLVLEKIFCNLDNEDLLRCRLVGPKSLWNNVACRVLKDKIVVRLQDRKAIKKLQKTFKHSIDGISITLQNLNINLRLLQLEDMRKIYPTIGSQVRNLNLCVGNAVLQKAKLEQLFELVYIHFPNLEMLGVTYDEKMSASRPTFSITRFKRQKLPKLKNITIVPSRYHGETERGKISALGCFINTIFRSAVHLESVTFQRPAYSSSSLLKQPLLQGAISQLTSPLLHQIVISRMPTSLENLRSLTSHCIHFALERVNIEMDAMTTNHLDLRNFFSHYCGTLKKLCLRFNYRFKMCFPLEISLERLSDLELENLHGCIDWRKLPGLKCIKLENCLIEGEMVPPRDSEQLVQIPGNISTCAPTNFLISLSLVNITCKLPLPLIFNHCKRLQRLELKHCAGVNNESICGMRSMELEFIQKQAEIILVEDDSCLDRKIQALVNEAKSYVHEYPYIGNLKDLRNLILYADRYVSEVILLCGIIHCGKLMQVELNCLTMRPKIAVCIINHATLHDLTTVAINNSCIKFKK